MKNRIRFGKENPNPKNEDGEVEEAYLWLTFAVKAAAVVRERCTRVAAGEVTPLWTRLLARDHGHRRKAPQRRRVQLGRAHTSARSSAAAPPPSPVAMDDHRCSLLWRNGEEERKQIQLGFQGRAAVAGFVHRQGWTTVRCRSTARADQAASKPGGSGDSRPRPRLRPGREEGRSCGSATGRYGHWATEPSRSPNRAGRPGRGGGTASAL
jgi:hypothetical protein